MPGDQDTRLIHAECAVETSGSGREYSVVFNPALEGGRHSFGPTNLEAHQAFVMGDNRDNSMDSRFTGPIETEAIVGRAVAIWFSFSWVDGIRWHRIGNPP